jgi:hypothetical protein
MTHDTSPPAYRVVPQASVHIRFPRRQFADRVFPRGLKTPFLDYSQGAPNVFDTEMGTFVSFAGSNIFVDKS